MNQNKRRWKENADGAMSLADFASERDRVALEIAAQIAGWCTTDEAKLGGLQDRVVGLVEDSWVRASLAAKCLDRLQGNLQTADYEDTHSLLEEISWTRAYLAPLIDPFLLHGNPNSLNRITMHRPEPYADRLFSGIALQLAPRLEIAAA
ncbi:MAG: hypothetical protein ACRYFU_14445 [Janthinobacterium lividum]